MRIPLLLTREGRIPPGPDPTTTPAPGADAWVVDLEGPTPGSEAARSTAATSLRRMEAGAAVRVVMLSPLSGGFADDDLDAVMPARPDAVMLRGATAARDIQHLAAKLAVREARLGLRAGSTGILAAIDTPAGVLALPGFAGASPRLRALAWDPDRFARTLGLADSEAEPCRQARGLVVLAAAAAGVPALAWPQASLPLAQACATAARDGFSGHAARHPDEVSTIARWFGAAAG